MFSCYNIYQPRPLALCMQGLSLGYRSVSVLAWQMRRRAWSTEQGLALRVDTSCLQLG